jgi:hypothetical protein
MLVYFSACRSSRSIQTTIPAKDTVSIEVNDVAKLKADSAKYIRETYARIENNRIRYNTFSAKIDVEYRDAEGKKVNATAHLRMYKDSVIWVSLTGPLGIEGIRAIITKDSLKWLDKQDKIYTTRSFSFLQELTELPLELNSLQDLLIGNPVFFDSTINTYSKGPGSISFLSIGQYFKNLFTISESDNRVQSSKLDDIDVLRNRTCYLIYAEYEDKKGPVFASKRGISVTEKKKLDIELDFKQYEFNETLSFPFTIPKNYKRN